jgi:hypothetical protein
VMRFSGLDRLYALQLLNVDYQLYMTEMTAPSHSALLATTYCRPMSAVQTIGSLRSPSSSSVLLSPAWWSAGRNVSCEFYVIVYLCNCYSSLTGVGVRHLLYPPQILLRLIINRLRDNILKISPKRLHLAENQRGALRFI